MDSIWIFIAYLAGAMIILVISRRLFKSLKFFVKLGLNTIVGGAVIFGINKLAAPTEFAIGLNIYSALTVGLLKIPGLILLVILKYML